MTKHSKLFYRAIARIRAFGEKNGVVYLYRLRQVFKIGYVRSCVLRDELIAAGVLREWDAGDHTEKSKETGVGNILWENLSKYRVPKEITQKEVARVKKELMSMSPHLK